MKKHPPNDVQRERHVRSVWSARARGAIGEETWRERRESARSRRGVGRARAARRRTKCSANGERPAGGRRERGARSACEGRAKEDDDRREAEAAMGERKERSRSGVARSSDVPGQTGRRWIGDAASGARWSTRPHTSEKGETDVSIRRTRPPQGNAGMQAVAARIERVIATRKHENSVWRAGEARTSGDQCG